MTDLLRRAVDDRYSNSGYTREINKDCTIIWLNLHPVECTGPESVDTETVEMQRSRLGMMVQFKICKRHLKKDFVSHNGLKR